jgi:uncharacterized membrane protein YciS (DUF1049 family)
MKLLNKIKQYLISIFAIIFIIMIFAFIIFIMIYLKNKKQKIQIHPEFKIIECKQEDNIEVLSSSIDIAKEILNKVQK